MQQVKREQGIPMQTLTLEGVKEAARAAYQAGTLTAQHPIRDGRRCRYEVDGKYHCAIGASLSEETLAAIRADETLNDMSVSRLIREKLVAVSREEQGQIENLQSLHDNWAGSARNNGEDYPTAIRQRAVFLAAIGVTP
jgi:hypothetical protein